MRGSLRADKKQCRYDEIRDLYIQQLAFAWVDDLTTEKTRVCVERKIDSFVGGDLEHGTEIVLALLEIATTEGDIKPPPNAPSSVSSLLFLSFALKSLSFVIRAYGLRIRLTGSL